MRKKLPFFCFLCTNLRFCAYKIFLVPIHDTSPIIQFQSQPLSKLLAAPSLGALESVHCHRFTDSDCTPL